MRVLAIFVKVLTFFVLAILLAQCLQCAPHRKPNDPSIKIRHAVYISDVFNPIEKQLIRDAAKEWELSTKNIVTFETVTFNEDYLPLMSDRNHSIVILDCPPDSPELALIDAEVKKKDKDNHALGYYRPGDFVPSIYFVTSRIKDRALFRQVAVHEFGHALGLDHNDSTDAIMYRSMEKAAKQITEKDLKKFCKKYNCLSDDLK